MGQPRVPAEDQGAYRADRGQGQQHPGPAQPVREHAHGERGHQAGQMEKRGDVRPCAGRLEGVGPAQGQGRGQKGRTPGPGAQNLIAVTGVTADEKHPGLVFQNLLDKALFALPSDHRVGGVAQGHPGGCRSQNRSQAGDQEGQAITPQGQAQSAHQKGEGVAQRGAGDEKTHGQAPAPDGVALGHDHQRGGVGSAQGETDQRVKDQGPRHNPGPAGRRPRKKTAPAPMEARKMGLAPMRSARTEQQTRETV